MVKLGIIDHIERAERRIDKLIPERELLEREPTTIRLNDPIDWIQRYFYIPERKEHNPPAIELAPYQIAVLREACRKDEQGKFIYNTVIWSDIKKSAKSSISAAIALYRAINELDWGSIKIIANDLKQADTRTAYYLRRALELNPIWRKNANYRQVGYTIKLAHNNTVIEAIPIDPSGEAGGNDDLIIFSETWAAKHKKAIQMFTEMTLSPNKFGYSQRWIETYAGYSGESPILEPLYEKCVQEENRINLSYDDYDLSDLEVYATDGILCLWNTRPRLPWQTTEYYANEESVLLPSEFLRLHRNQWISSTEKFVDMLWWDNCKETLPSLTKDEVMVLAIDASKGSQSQSYTADCFSVVGITRHPHNPKNLAIRYAGIWQPVKGQLLDFGPIEQEIRRLCNEFNIIEVAYDPYQLHDMATRMKSEGAALFREFSQGKPRLIADKQLQDLIINHRIAHDGNPLLRQHIDNANVKLHGEDGVRIVKRSQDLKVDAAVSLSMAAGRCLHYNLG